MPEGAFRYYFPVVDLTASPRLASGHGLFLPLRFLPASLKCIRRPAGHVRLHSPSRAGAKLTSVLTFPF